MQKRILRALGIRTPHSAHTRERRQTVTHVYPLAKIARIRSTRKRAIFKNNFNVMQSVQHSLPGRNFVLYLHYYYSLNLTNSCYTTISTGCFFCTPQSFSRLAVNVWRWHLGG